MVLYSKFMYGCQFSGENNDLKIHYLVTAILSKITVLFFLGHPVFVQVTNTWVISIQVTYYTKEIFVKVT